MNRSILSCIGIGAASVLASQAYAATLEWNGAVDGNYATTVPTTNFFNTTMSTQSTTLPVIGTDTLLFDLSAAAANNQTTVTLPAGILGGNSLTINYNTANCAAYTFGNSNATFYMGSGTTERIMSTVINDQTINANITSFSRSTGGALLNLRNDSSTATFVFNGNYANQITDANATAGGNYTLNFFGGGKTTFNGVIANSSVAGATATNTTGVQVTGGGVVTLTGANTYGLATTVGLLTSATANTLYVNNTAGSGTGVSPVSVQGLSANTSVLGGSGSIAGTIAINSGGSLRPGATATGTANLVSTNASTAALVLASGSTSVFDINGATKGTNYDAFTDAAVGSTITYGGTLTINGNSVSTGTYDLFSSSLTGGDFASITLNLGATPVTLGEAVAGSGVWTATSGANTYTFTTATGDLVVAAVGVPEPASLGLVAGGAALLAARRRRAV